MFTLRWPEKVKTFYISDNMAMEFADNVPLEILILSEK